MFVTNGKKIVALPYDYEKVEELAKELKKRAQDRLGIKKAKFTITEEPYPHLVNDENLPFEELKKLFVPDMDLQFRAIGNERVQLPTRKLKDIRHEFTVEEKQALAENICNTQAEKETTEAEKAQVNKGYKERIDGMELTISEQSKKYREGYEMRNLECDLHLDFENKARVYTSPNDGKILHTEELQPDDYQFKLELKDDKPQEPANSQQNLDGDKFIEVGEE